MAKVTATVFKSQIATAAPFVQDALRDDTLTEMAAEFKNPHHPLRKIAKLFLYNPANGAVTANDAYIDAAYAGEYPNVGSGADKIND